MGTRRVAGWLERLILGAVMSVILLVVERSLTSGGDMHRVQRLLHLVKGRR